jgi:purine-binding chemotaxis protein CheW
LMFRKIVEEIDCKNSPIHFAVAQKYGFMINSAGKIDNESERERDRIMDEIVGSTMDEEEDTQRGRFLTFLIGNETYGIEIRYVTEIIGIQAITELSEMPDYIKGIINLRGKIIPVMDVRLRFKKEFREYDERTCIIVIDINEIAMGLIVDSVSEVLFIDEQDIAEPPKLNCDQQNRYIMGIGKVGNEVRLLLNCDKLLTEDEIEELGEAL